MDWFWRIWEELKQDYSYDVIAEQVERIGFDVLKASIILLAFFIIYRIVRAVLRRVIERFELENSTHCCPNGL